MAYRRGGVFRYRHIAPLSQRIGEVLSKPLAFPVDIAYDATARDLVTTVADNVNITLPLTVSAATGKERLIIIGGTSNAAGGGDVDAVTIDGQPGIRISTVKRAFPTSGATSTFVTAYRAPGTGNTSINVTLTANTPDVGSSLSNLHVSCWNLSNAGTVYASASSAVYDPTLNVNTITEGAVAAGVMGYSVGAFGAAASPPTYRSQTLTAYDSSNPKNITKPSGVAADDILIALWLQVRAGVTPTDPPLPTGGTTWTLLDRVEFVDNFSAYGKFSVYWKRAGGSEPSSYTFDIDSGGEVNSTQGLILAYSGCIASGSPIDVYSESFGTGAPGTTATATTVTTTVDNTKLLYVGNNWTGNGALTPPTGMTERADSVVYASDETRATAGATGNRTQTLAESAPWSAYLIALKPAAGGGGGGGAVTAWTGATERYDDATSDLVFTAAGNNIASASTPLALTANITPDLTATAASTASIALSFDKIGGTSTITVPALGGGYVVDGFPVSIVYGKRITAQQGSYAVNGQTVTTQKRLTIVAAQGNYAVTGFDIVLDRNLSPAVVTYEKAAADATDKTNTQTYTFNLSWLPLPGGGGFDERVVLLGGVSGTDATYSAVTIGGVSATQIGTLSRGATDSSGYAAFITAWRVPVASFADTVTVVATVSGTLKTQTQAYCASYRVGGITDGFFAKTNRGVNDPNLSTDTSNKGIAIGGLVGYSDALGPTTTWSGLTEDFDAVRASGDDVFTGASGQITLSRNPQPILVNNDPNMAGAEDSVASTLISFLADAAVNTITATNGGYSVSGQPVTIRFTRKAVASTVGDYQVAGQVVAVKAVRSIVASTVGNYQVTGFAVGTIRSGANRSLPTQQGSYLVTNPVTVNILKGRKAAALQGSYLITLDSPVLVGRGLIALSGAYAVNGNPVVITKVGSPNISISVGGFALNASVNSVTVNAHAGTSVTLTNTGLLMTAAVGNETVTTQGGVSFSVTNAGLGMTASVNSVSVAISGGITFGVTNTGLGMSALVNSVSAEIPGQVTISAMPAMQASVGNVLVNITGSVNVQVFGNYMFALTNDVTVGLTSSISVNNTGLGMTALVNSVASVGGQTTVTLTNAGLDMTAVVGTVSVTAKQNISVNVTGNAMVAYVGTLLFAGSGTPPLAPSLDRNEGFMLAGVNWMGT